MTIRVIEFYSGIGGMHHALKMAGVDAHVIAAFDTSSSANATYTHNFGKGIAHHRNIGSLSAKELQDMSAEMWLMSPACQPYTVIGKQRGIEDPRAQSFLHLINPEVLGVMTIKPNYVLVENVAGFEKSNVRDHLVQTFVNFGYKIQEFLLNPLQFGIPNSRLRYYFLAVKKDILIHDTTLTYENVIKRYIPGLDDKDWIPKMRTRKGHEKTPEIIDDISETDCPIRDYLDKNVDGQMYAIPDRVLMKWGRLFDIVMPSTRRSCCFTRGYTRMVEKGGSILQENEQINTTQAFLDFAERSKNEQVESNLQDERSKEISEKSQESLKILQELSLRYFTPMEISRLMGFNKVNETTFTFPENISIKSQYRLLGNSINCVVVTHLIQYLVDSKKW